MHMLVMACDNFRKLLNQIPVLIPEMEIAFHLKRLGKRFFKLLVDKLKHGKLLFF